MVRNFRSFACQDTITRNETMKDSKDTLLAGLTTEARNPHTLELDQLDTLELVKLINAEDALVASAVESESENIARAIDVIAERLARGGRLVYVGAGTSGRLGVLDAAECPPTFNLLNGIFAGNFQKIHRSRASMTWPAFNFLTKTWWSELLPVAAHPTCWVHSTLPAASVPLPLGSVATAKRL